MKPILTDLYQKWMSDGELFTMMGIRHVTPWAEETDGKALDLEYFGNRSGSKIVAPLLEKMLTETGLSDAAKQNIVDLIWIRFGRNWTKLWNTLTVEYNPIENYRMTETGKINHDGDQQNDVYGFNSTAAVPSGTGHDEYIDNTELTRSGNIGVTTSQQMIQSERDLWVWKFFEQVFQDVDTVLSIDVYGQSCLGDFSEYHGTSYVLPPATAESLGGIKVGENLSITPDGTLSAQGGGGLNYSTEEQDTGLTWIDGRHVYQKSYYVQTMTGKYLELETGVPTTYRIISADGSASMSGNIQAFGYVSTSYFLGILVRNQIIGLHSNYAPCYDVMITIRYIK